MARTLTGLALGAAALSAPSSLAQSAGAVDAAQHAFDVPAGALDQALSRFGRQAQVLVSVNAELTTGLSSPGVSGSHTALEALALLLSGTGLEAVAQPDGSYSLRKAPPPSAAGGNRAVMLSALTVTGQALQPGRPVEAGGSYVGGDRVVGTKTETPVLETPQSISVVTQQQLQAQAVQSVSEALRYMPGVLAEQYGGSDTRADNYVVRGFADSFPYLDGLSTLTYFSLLSPVVEPYGLERVEVLRGPSSVLNGQTGSPGGLVSLVSKRPPEQRLREVSLESGSYGRVQGSFDFGGPASDDHSLLYRLTGLGRDTGSQIDFVNDRRFYLAPALTWKPSADTSLTWLAHFSYRNANNPPDDLPTIGTLLSNPNGRISTRFFDREPGFDQFRRIEEAIGYSFERRIGEALTLRQNTRYVHATLDQKLVIGLSLEGDLRTLDRAALGAQAGVNTFAIDNQAELRFSTGALRHSLLFGLDYLHSVDDYAERDGSAASIDVYAPVYGAPISLDPVSFSITHTIDQLGVYGQDQIRYGHWIGTVAGRRDLAKTQTVDRLADPTSAETRDDSNAYTWRAGLVYRFDNGLAPYASAATSFTPAIGTTFDGTPLSANTGSSYEAGLKYQPADGHSLLTVSAYTLTENNVLTPDQAHMNFEIQTGKIRVRGLELSELADLGGGLHLTAAFTYMNGKQIANDNGTAGDQAPNVPHWLISSWVDKTLRQGALRGLGLGGGVRYVGPQWGDPDNTLELPGTSLLDGSLHYARGHWYFAADGKNLLDRTYVGSCPALDSCNYGLRRNVLLRASYAW